MLGSIRVQKTSDGTNGIIPTKILEEYPERYLGSMPDFRDWLITELNDGNAILVREMEDLANPLQKGETVTLLYHYLRDGDYCYGIKQVLEVALGVTQ